MWCISRAEVRHAECMKAESLARVGDCHGDFKSLSGFVVETYSPRPTCQEVFWSASGSRWFTDGCEKHLCLRGSRFANQVIHQGDGPKLPYQAVVIRQSAIYRQGRKAVDTAGGVVPHTRSGPVPTFVFFSDVQAGQNRGQQVANGTSASTTLRTLL